MHADKKIDQMKQECVAIEEKCNAEVIPIDGLENLLQFLNEDYIKIQNAAKKKLEYDIVIMSKKANGRKKTQRNRVQELEEKIEDQKN